jgi:membrane-associated phospholipid phosphatase
MSSPQPPSNDPKPPPDEHRAANPLPIPSEPSPEAKAAAEPAREAVEEAVRQIQTPEQAEQVAQQVISAAQGVTEPQVRESNAASPTPAEAIKATAQATSGTEEAAATLVEAARQVAGSSGETREALEQAVTQATGPEREDAAEAEATPSHGLLREAILKQMKPYQALDVRLFLAINHLPHNRLTNGFMYFMTTIMNGGFIWLVILAVASVIDRPHGRKALLQAVPPFTFATLIVEYPVKYYFRRRRPFVDVVQAIAVGRKPGTYSFPSGHSAASFAGAWLLRRHYPKLALLWYGIAALVAFSRIFVGAHYPGDVLSGAVSGTLLAELARWVIDQGDDLDDLTAKR